MEQWSINIIKDIQAADDLLTIKTALIDIKEALGFSHVLYTVRVPNTLTRFSHFIMGDYPEKWLSKYIEEGYVKIDPVIKHCSNSSLPYYWRRLQDSKDPAIINFVKDAIKHNFAEGVSTGMHTPNGENCIYSMVSDHVIDNRSGESLRTGSYMTIFQPYLYEAINRLSAYKPHKNRLSQRETECLMWSAEGKTSDEIAIILSIKTSTVVFHLKNAINKLNVTNRNQAIAKAVLFGIISPQYSSHSTPPAYQF